MTGSTSFVDTPSVETDAAPLLAVRGLSKSFGGVRAVADLSFSLRAGELLALIGPNGAGKSTCFGLVNGQLAPDAGEVRLDGARIDGRPPRKVWRLGVGRTFQVASTFGSLRAVENVQLALLSHDGRALSPGAALADRRRDAALSLLSRVGLAAQADRPAAVLAYGDVKRLELAIALAHEPRLLLMDEPTAGMAPAEREALMALVRKLAKARGIGVLFTEHSMDVVFGHADRVLVMARGARIAEGTPDAIRDDPRVREVYLGGAEPGAPDGTLKMGSDPISSSPIPSDLASPEPALTDAGPPASTASGSTFPEATAARSGTVPAAPPVLALRGLDASYGDARVLFGVDLSLREGEVVALMGRNGAGKSTTMKAIMGLVERRGEVRLHGLDTAGWPTHRIARAGVGWVPEDRRVFTDLTVMQNLETGRRPPRDGRAPWTPERLFRLFPNLGAMPDRPAGRMSGGEQQMLTVARTLMGNPSVLLLDEPSEGVAPVIVEKMAEAVLALRREGLSILLSEQNLVFARRVADRAVVLERGEVRFDGPLETLSADRRLLADTLGL